MYNYGHQKPSITLTLYLQQYAERKHFLMIYFQESMEHIAQTLMISFADKNEQNLTT